MRYVSIFSGIEAASVAWEPLGWEPLAFAEIDPFPCAVLAERFPDVPNLGSVTDIDWSGFIEAHGRPDVVVGGSPCQSFSIAGKREGLAGASGLMFEYIRAVQELRPKWFVWENVPGALTSEHGAAFGQLLTEMDALGYGQCWRVLDAQFFGVAQRRERVFLVGRLGGEPPAEVLFEREGLPWDFATSRKKREELTARAGRCAQSAGFKFHQGGQARGLGEQDEQSPTLTADWHNPAVYSMTGTTSNAAVDYDLAGTQTARQAKRGGFVAFAQNTRDEVRYQGDGELSGALAANPGMKQTTYVCETAHSGSNGWGVGESSVYPTLDTAAPPSAAVMQGVPEPRRPAEQEGVQPFSGGPDAEQRHKGGHEHTALGAGQLVPGHPSQSGRVFGTGGVAPTLDARANNNPQVLVPHGR